MRFEFSAEEDQFRAEVREMLAEQLPDSDADEEVGDPAFEKRLAEQGWLTAAWPKEFGGRGATQIQQLIMKEELFRIGAALPGQGINLVGPTLMVHGSEEQRREHLPK